MLRVHGYGTKRKLQGPLPCHVRFVYHISRLYSLCALPTTSCILIFVMHSSLTPPLRRMIDWGHVLVTHLPQLMVLGCVLLFAQIVHQVVVDHDLYHVEWSMSTWHKIVYEVRHLFVQLFRTLVWDGKSGVSVLLSPAVQATALALLVGAYWMRQQRPVYLLSFATFQAPDSWKVSHAQIVEMLRRQNCFTPDALDFMARILERSGTGQSTAWPPGIVQCLQGDNETNRVPADRSIAASRQEAETIIFDIVQRALDQAKVNPKEIDVLVINCSLFSPTPSLCAMVVAHFGMRADVSTYNLSGMGCSASLIAVDLAQQLLRSYRTQGAESHGKALVVSTEIITPNLYHGQDRAFLIQNTLFRCGGAAMVLSNSWMDGRRAWYKLLHLVRVQGTSEQAIQAVYEAEDSEGERGVRLSKDLVKVAGQCMEKNFTILGPSVLPLTEQAKVVVAIAVRWVLKHLAYTLKKHHAEEWLKKLPTVKPYVPDFKRGVDHFCIHAGGRAVIDGIEKNLGLKPYHTEPSRMTLLNYGNTSSSSIWYELQYIQEKQKTNPLKKGDRIMQVAFGSGFKCTSAVWVKL
jgi:predicted naringenin-chalcone synthase